MSISGINLDTIRKIEELAVIKKRMEETQKEINRLEQQMNKDADYFANTRLKLASHIERYYQAKAVAYKGVLFKAVTGYDDDEKAELRLVTENVYTLLGEETEQNGLEKRS